MIYTSANKNQNWEHCFQPSSVHLTVTVGKDKSSQRRLFILMGRDNKNHRGFPFWPGWNFKGWKRVIFILHFNYPRPLMLVVDISINLKGMKLMELH